MAQDSGLTLLLSAEEKMDTANNILAENDFVYGLSNFIVAGVPMPTDKKVLACIIALGLAMNKRMEQQRAIEQWPVKGE